MEFGKKLKIVNSELLEDLKKQAMQVGISPDQALEEIKKIYDEKCFAGMNEESRILTAVRVFRVTVAKRLLSKAESYEVFVFDKTGVTTFTDGGTGKTRKSGRFYGVCKSDKPEQKYVLVRGAFYDDKANLIESVKLRSWIKARMVGSLKGGELMLYSDDTTTVEPLDAPSVDVAEIEKVIKSLYPEKQIAELPASPEGIAIYLRASVVDVQAGESNGRHWGRYLLIDDSIPLQDLGAKTKNALTAFVDGAQARYASGSDVGIVGVIQKSQDGVLTLRGHMLLPFLAYDMEPPKEATSESPDVKIEQVLDSTDEVW